MENLIYRTLYKNGKAELEINKSKFIASSFPIQNQEQAIDLIEKISDQYKDATHNCYAYVISNSSHVEKFSDDGEPSGTAGLPILRTIKSKELINTLIIVTRYFGGIKLGKGGLVRAYTNAALEAILDSKIAIMKKHSIYKITIGYSHKNIVDKVIKEQNLSTENLNYLDKITMEIAIEIDRQDQILRRLIDATNGEINIEKINDLYKPFSVE
ncbi:MAG TPA: YigZ family protein [Soehngenia sp.]|nr:YigZ family protein [Soehngenia sp.]HPP31940.1 YigZ family protein [Soehngenia sp.]